MPRFQRARHLADFPRVQIRRHADDSFRAHRHKRKCQRVVATQNGNGVAHRLLQLIDPINAAARFLNPSDMLVPRSQSFDDSHTDLDATTRAVGAALIRQLKELLPVESQPLLEQRYARYRKFGAPQEQTRGSQER